MITANEFGISVCPEKHLMTQFVQNLICKPNHWILLHVQHFEGFEKPHFKTVGWATPTLVVILLYYIRKSSSKDIGSLLLVFPIGVRSLGLPFALSNVHTCPKVIESWLAHVFANNWDIKRCRGKQMCLDWWFSLAKSWQFSSKHTPKTATTATATCC